MNLFGKSIDGAFREAGKLQEARGRLAAELITDEARRNELRSQLGQAELSALLDGGDTGATRREIADLDSKIAGRLAARPVLLERLRTTLKSLWRARAEEKRQDAAKLQNELQPHEEKTADLLAKLEKHTGVKFQMVLKVLPPPGTMFVASELADVTPRAWQMRAEIASLRAEADAIENGPVWPDRISGSSIEELLGVASNVELIAPTVAEIVAWNREASARADQEWAQRMVSYADKVEPGRDIVIELAWNPNTGVIDQAASRHENIELRSHIVGFDGFIPRVA